MMGANQSGATLGTSEPIEVLDISDDEETVPQTRARCRRRIYDEKPIDLTVDSDEEVERPAPTMSLRSGKTMGKRRALLDEDMQRSLRKAKRLRNAEPLFIDLSDDDDDEDPALSRGQGRPRSQNQQNPSINLTLDSDEEALAGDVTLDDNDSAMPERLIQERLKRAEKLNAKQQQADAALARRLAKEEEKELGKVMKRVQEKSEGIVFKVAIDTETSLLADGSSAHPDDLARFEPGRINSRPLVSNDIHWVVNYELEKRFEESRDILRDICGEEPRELQLFHGTRPENIDSILNSGFRIGGMGGHAIVNGTLQGYGVYLAADPNLSLGHAPNATRIFACRVLAGRTTGDLQYSQTLPKAEVGSGQFETYSGIGIYVVRHTQLVLPCYMIEFEIQPNPYYAAFGVAAIAPAPVWAGWGAFAAPGLLAGAVPPPAPAPLPLNVSENQRRLPGPEAKRRSSRLKVKAEA
ncbi:hypothetical protein CPB85DRAFT_1337235 [Mucidula mucida]|nr:hypothetical protein CPB85DRAFT_1337235 [Mucidula mucida]